MAQAGIPDSAVYTNWEDLIKDENVELVDALLPVQFNLEVCTLMTGMSRPISNSLVRLSRPLWLQTSIFSLRSPSVCNIHTYYWTVNEKIN